MAAHILIVDDEPDMGHATKIKSVNSIFVATSLITSLITLCFGIYEHRREHQFRCDILHAKLQLNNYTRRDSSIRVTVIDTTGKVLFDNQKDSPALMGNHRHRVRVSHREKHRPAIWRFCHCLRNSWGGLTITIVLEIIP